MNTQAVLFRPMQRGGLNLRSTACINNVDFECNNGAKLFSLWSQLVLISSLLSAAPSSLARECFKAQCTLSLFVPATHSQSSLLPPKRNEDRAISIKPTLRNALSFVPLIVPTIARSLCLCALRFIPSVLIHTPKEDSGQISVYPAIDPNYLPQSLANDSDACPIYLYS